jgi:hypothetical protein
MIAETGMYDIVSNLTGGQLVLLTLVVGAFAFGLILMVFVYLSDVRDSDNNARLKQDMLDRGMSANEIKIVLEAGARTGPKLRWYAHPEHSEKKVPPTCNDIPQAASRVIDWMRSSMGAVFRVMGAPSSDSKRGVRKDQDGIDSV